MLLTLSTAALAADTWNYYFPITIIDTSGSDRTNLPVLLGFAGQNMVDAGYMNSSGTDTRMRQGSTDIEYMLSTTQVPVYVDSLTANGQKTYNFYTGYSPVQTTFDILVGDEGYITVTDDAALELGGNYEVEFEGYVTIDGDELYLFKEDAFAIYSNTSGKILASSLATSDKTNPTGFNDPDSAWSDETTAYDDDTNFGADISTAVPADSWSSFIELTIGGTPVGCYAARFYAEADGDWTQIDVDAYYDSAWHDIFQGAHTNLTWTTVYWYSLENVTNLRFRFYNDDGSPQTEGDILRDVDYIELDPNNVAGTVEKAGLSTGEVKVKVTDGAQMVLYIDDVQEDTAVGLDVTDTANDWYFMRENTMPYADFLKITVGGTLIAHYEPTAMITSTTLPDREGTAQNGTITWGSNSNITITYGSMVSSEATSSTVSQTGLGFTVPSADMPSQWFAAGGSLTSLPLYPMFNSISTETNIPVQSLYMWFILSIGVALSVWVYMSTRSILLGSLIITVCMIVGSAMTVIPAWMFFIYILVSGGLMYLMRQI